MASPARSGFPARTNSRLDAFLRRHLAPEVYDAVRAYEPCIVVSDAEKHTFKYVVLSDRLIFLTENPPRSIRRVVALRDVVAIDLELEQSEKELRTRRENVPEAKLEIYAGITEGHGKFEFTWWIAEIKECKRFNILKEIAISGLFWPNQRLNIVMSYYYCRQ